MLTAVERVLILQRAELLKDVGPRHLLRLAEVAREVDLWKGENVYGENDPADALYLVVEGKVRLWTDGKVTSEVGPGEAFGTWALVDDSDRGHRVECVEDGLALALDRDEFYEVASADLALLQQVVRALAKRLRALAAERPEEARIEPEGQEGPIEEKGAASTASSAIAEELPDAGEALEAAALGQPASAIEAAAVPAEPELELTAPEVPSPEPILPVEPPDEAGETGAMP